MKARIADPTRFDPYFVSLAFNSRKARSQIEARIRTTAGQHGVSGSDVKSVELELPDPHLQRALGSYARRLLEQCDSLDQAIASRRESATALREVILRAAFAGGLA
jgi:type I restriction enzyme S subunit